MKYSLSFFLFFFGFQSYSQDLVNSEIKSNYQQGIAFLEEKKFDKAIISFNKGIKVSKSLDNTALMALGQFNLSECYLALNKHLESINAANEALILYKRLKRNMEISNCYARLGDIYFKISNFDTSHNYYFEALKIKEQLNDELGIAENLVSIGKIYKITPDPDLDLPKARVNFNKALKIYEKLGHQEGIIYNLTDIGAINLKEGINHSDQEKIVKAIDIFKQALVKAENLKLVKSQAILLGNIGPSLRMLDRNEESLDYLFSALEIKLILKDSTSAAHSCNDISETYIAMNDLHNAKKYALKAVDLAKGVSLNQERFAFYLLSEINNSLGDYKSANNDLKQFYKLADSIFSAQKMMKINENQIKYETEKKSLTIRAQESDIALLNEKNKVKNQYMVLGTFGLISVFGFIIIVRSRNREKHKQLLQAQFSRDLLQSQEEERIRIAKDLHDSVGQQLTLIKKKSQRVNQEEISQLTNNALEDVRSISRGLYPAMLHQFGLTDSIEQLILDFDEQTDLFFSSDIANIDAYLNEEESLNFYRFMQESLSNVVKHSKAKAVSVFIEKLQDKISVSIQDNGIGFIINETKKQNSLGLKTLAERIEILKGNFKIDSQLKKGTTLSAIIPTA